MKNGKRLNLKEKRFLTKQGLNPEDFLISKKTAYDYVFVHRITGKSLVIRR